MSEDYIALDWVKGTIEETLNQAQRFLEASVEEPSSKSEKLTSCIDSVHQVHGTLLMLEFYGAALLAEEIELVALAIIENQVANEQDCLEVLMSALIQLPYYLDHVKVGRRDLPIVLLPILNELRSVRGAPFLSETALFNPKIKHNPPIQEDVKHQLSEEKLEQWLKKTRQLLQVVMVQLFQGQGAQESKHYLEKIFSRLNRAVGATPQGVVWLPALAFSEWLMQQKSIPKSAKVLLRQLDQLLKHILDEGVSALNVQASDELLKNILFYVAETSVKGRAIALVQDRFALSQAIPKETKDLEGENVSSGSVSEAFSSAISVLIEEITAIKEDIDLIIRNLAEAKKEFPQLTERLQRIADTMGIMSLGVARTQVLDQIQTLKQLDKQEPLVQEAFAHIANALLSVEASLKGVLINGQYTADTNSMSEAEAVLIKEVRNTLQEVKDSVLLYLTRDQSPEYLMGVPELLKTIKGSLTMIPIDRMAEIIERLIDFLSKDKAPKGKSIEVMADVLTGVDYYLEHYDYHSLKNDDVLSRIEDSVEQLIQSLKVKKIEEELEEDKREYVPPVFLPDMEFEAVSDADDTQEEKLETSKTEEQTEAEVTSAYDEIDLIDEDIIDVFLEEAGDVLEVLTQTWPKFKINTEDSQALSVSRRAFHTLKGSGRMVGADQIAELSWSVENMLNRLIDQQISITDALLTLVEEVIEALPSLIDSYSKKVPLEVDRVELLKSQAEQLAEGNLPPALEQESKTDIAIAPDRYALLEIFIGEASQHVDIINEFIGDSRREYFSNRVSEGCRRALHTLKGGGYTADLNPIAELAAPLEQLVIKFREYHIENSSELVDLLDDAVSSIVEVLTPEALAELSSLPNEESLCERIALMEQGLADRLIQQNLDPDEGMLAALLSVEMDAALDAEEHLKSWLEEGRVEVLDDLMNDLGNISTAANEVGITPMLDLAFALKRFYQTIRQTNTKPSEALIAIAQDAQEELLNMMDCIASGLDVNSAEKNIQAIQTWITENETQDSGVIDQESHSRTSPFTDAHLDDVEQVLKTLAVLLYEWRSAFDKGALLANVQKNISELNRLFRGEGVNPAISSVLTGLEALGIKVDIKDGMQAELTYKLLGQSYDYLFEQLDLIKQGEVTLSDTALVESIRNAIKEFSKTSEQEYQQAQEIEPRVKPISIDESDREIVEIFLEESEELMEAFDHSVEEWKSNQGSRDAIDEKLRILHTLKGGARLAGLLEIGDTAHDLEAELQEIIDNNMSVDERFFRHLSERQEVLHQQIDQVSNLLNENSLTLASFQTVDSSVSEPITEPRVDADKNIEQELTTDTPLEENHTDASYSAPALATVLGDEPTVPAQETSFTDTASPLKATASDAVTQVNRKAPADMVRVSADLLDNLVNLAGETAIGRSRFEQQVNDYSVTLAEMDQTIERLNDQVRRLDIETEAQVLYGHERQGPNYDDFDPLEMDRYSTMQQLSRALMESKSDLSDLRDTLKEKTQDAEAALLQQGRVNTELQQGLMKTRMVPFQQLVPRLRRIVRQVSLELNKQVDFSITNAEGEMDRTLLERMVSPLEHMIRNAIDHGIELTEERVKSGKPEYGSLELSLRREGGDILMSLKDDGHGIDLKKVLEKARALGMVGEDEQPAEEEIIQFILAPGFSTVSEVTQISGRGIGMDVIGSEIKQMGGTVAISSSSGSGTTIEVRLPFTVSVNRALMVRLGTDNYAIPLNDIEGIVRIHLSELHSLYSLPQDERKFNYAGNEYQLNYLGMMLSNSPLPSMINQNISVPLILIRGSEPTALQVDSLQGSQEVVVKSLGPQLASVSSVSGGTILGDGSVVIILDVPAMIRSRHASDQSTPIVVNKSVVENDPQDQSTQVLVVDDSVTVRKVTSRVLERNSYDVKTAKDGVHALEVLQNYRPDIILLDIEMPHMDGFELATHLRYDSQLKSIPIIMITSRTGEKHRERAKTIGVERYMGKPFQEEALLAEMSELLTQRGKLQ